MRGRCHTGRPGSLSYVGGDQHTDHHDDHAQALAHRVTGACGHQVMIVTNSVLRHGMSVCVACARGCLQTPQPAVGITDCGHTGTEMRVLERCFELDTRIGGEQTLFGHLQHDLLVGLLVFGNLGDEQRRPLGRPQLT